MVIRHLIQEIKTLSGPEKKRKYPRSVVMCLEMHWDVESIPLKMPTLLSVKSTINRTQGKGGFRGLARNSPYAIPHQCFYQARLVSSSYFITTY